MWAQVRLLWLCAALVGPSPLPGLAAPHQHPDLLEADELHLHCEAANFTGASSQELLVALLESADGQDRHQSDQPGPPHQVPSA